ncbi:MAG: phosphatase PAP2 family protein [Pseudomonadota bacterium]|jgi:lipid A 4'-phosphatase|uniref:phosphatase PAP2 family protein n=1 Tax=Curvibacter delicatus TaxID=80879 RepID=UPI00082C7223|nr:phosphatase PAP2 family protein [Curvibacter delicatus]MEA3395711.1 phosphatase PAP2 family protein [Pseudomonadota bacterium]
MSKTPPSSRTVFLLLLGSSLAVAMLPVLWPQLDIAAAAYFLQPTPPINPAQWKWVELVNEYVPDLFRTLALLCIAAWIIISLLRRWRRAGIALAFVGISLLLGPGFVTWAVKEHTLRARPFDVVEFGGERQFTPALVQADQCSDNCAFVSGHVACGFFFASLMLLDPRRRGRWIATGLLLGALVSVARMSVGAHWLSDALWALPITLATSGCVWVVLTFFYKYGQRPTQA